MTIIRFFSLRQTRLVTFLFLTIVSLIPCDAYSAEAQNIRLVGYCDLQGRDALQVVLKGKFAYVGHHRGTERNPLTGRTEPNVTT